MTNKIIEKKEKKLSLTSKVLVSWQLWFLITTLILLTIFAAMEVEYNKTTPGEWSLGIDVLDDVPGDLRKIAEITRPNDEGITLAYIVDQGMKLVEFDWLGEIQRSSIIELDTTKLKLVDIELTSDAYQVYISDRHTLNRLDINQETLSLDKDSLISDTSEHFDVDGRAIIVGNDDQTEILVDNKVVATLPSDTNLKRVKILTHGEKVYAIMDTPKGGILVLVDGDQVIEKRLTDASDIETYGELKDIHIAEGIVTVMSSYYKFMVSKPTALGVWQMDADTLADNSFRVFYHPKTALAPEIVHVDGEKITYILGVQQTLDQVKGFARLINTQSALFTNISKYTREGNLIIDNTRLSLTHKYPIGYTYFKSDKRDILLWVDRVDRDHNQYQLLLAGKGEPWVGKAYKSFNVNYSEIITSTILSSGCAVVFGPLFLLMNLALRIKLILGFMVLAFVYFKWFPLDQSNVREHIFIASILFAIIIKCYIIAITNGDVKAYGHIYPIYFGNQTVLIITSIFTSFLSMGLTKLWHRRYWYIDSLLTKFCVFIGFEAFFYTYTIGVYIISAMLKNDFMV